MLEKKTNVFTIIFPLVGVACSEVGKTESDIYFLLELSFKSLAITASD